MLNPRLDLLSDYPFARLRALLDHEPTPAGLDVVNLSIGEPQHAMPAFVGEHLSRDLGSLSRYPTPNGSPDYRIACAAWLTRRYNLPEGLIEPDRQIVALSGTREGLYMIAQVVVPEKKGPKGERPLVLMPNPFYQTYVGAAVTAGADPYFVAATPDNGFLPDFAGLPRDVLARTALVYLCSPANPQGTVASIDYMAKLIELAREHDFVIAFDECYAEIYGDVPPTGGMEAAMHLSGGRITPDCLKNVIVFHSLSKRSSVPGLRSGFCSGDPAITQAFIKLRNYGCAGVPMPVIAASAALWREESHVEQNRALYREKFDIAQSIIGNRFGFFRPAGGFYLWLDVGDPEAAALKLWREAGLRTLPGNYLTRPENGGEKAGKSFLRLALVADVPTTRAALQRFSNTLGS
ncbi:aminotransferase class I/II-fold pyridoxal phosphate-dependent enzyme [Ferrovibrio xuzhouensis]|uniref:Aminotransferase class I/II-fold pyridoxal phosphate-dependent enzyme n=1 Tax=Ferrovibrio xuzhouensis TaxID=1576914 RepID=A0ABV7VBU0_9PROT